MVRIMSHRRSLRFSKTTCPICGSKEVARDDNKGDLLCTNCGHIIVRTETRSVGKFDVAQHLKRNGKMNFSSLQQVTGASDDKLFGVIQNMVNMGLISDIGGNYSLSKKGQRWYRQRLGQEWGY
ncbi:MAG: TFIIB-type zinc ribbon-containing protein [Candidatus Thorarchaeota archaeon]